MSATTERRLSERVLVLAPTRGDADLCRQFLGAAGVGCHACRDVAELVLALASPAAVLVVTDEALQDGAGDRIREALATQEEWSAMPVIVLTRELPQASLQVLEDYEVYGRVTLLERPVRLATFVSAVQMALAERRQQYRIRDLLADRAARIAERDEFLALLGHELRNPLAAILTCSDVLDWVPPGSEACQDCRRVIRNQAQQIKRLLDDLLDLSRISRHKLALAREPVDLRAVLHDTLDQVRGPISARDQSLEVDLPSRPLPLFADPTRLRQVFANLLTNASRYSSPGGHIALTVRAENGLAVVRVRDDGVGMTRETLEKVFRPFYQATESGNGTRSGLGVGLTLARGLVEMHAGSIRAESPGLGQGSEFIVSLPIQPLAELPALPVAPPPADRPRPRRVLIIEDNRGFAHGLQLLLEDRGHRVEVAGDGAAGIEAARRGSPEVVLLDLALPGLDGYQVARRLRRLPGTAATRIIAVTGYAREEDRRRSLKAGIDRHLVKPVSLAELEAAIGE